jgi:hypothetical protein
MRSQTPFGGLPNKEAWVTMTETATKTFAIVRFFDPLEQMLGA